MKIAFVSTNEHAPWGGSEELWSQTAIRMVKQGFDVGISIKGWKSEAKQVSEIEQSGCIVVRRWQKSIIQRGISKFYNPSDADVFLKNFKPELVIISQGNSIQGLGWMEACIINNIPFVLIPQAAAENFWPSDDMAIRFAKAYILAKRCFFISHANLKLTEKQLAVKLENAIVVANPFKVPYDIQVNWPEDNKIFKLACVGRLEPVAKGQDLLLEAFKLDKWQNRPIEISLFGKGDNQKSLYELKKIWNIENVNFYGFVDNVESIWKTHHALILPSRYEGLPITIVEAMLCARPCIVTDVAGNAELIEDGVSGFIAVAPKVECLDDALERAWQKRYSWYEIGQTAAINVRKLIPRDPVGVFVNELKALLKS